MGLKVRECGNVTIFGTKKNTCNIKGKKKKDFTDDFHIDNLSGYYLNNSFKFRVNLSEF